MKESMNNEFISLCKTDIDAVLSNIKEYVPDLKEWQLNQSAILEADKKVLCKATYDEDNNKDGYRIDICLQDDETYTVFCKDNSLRLEKNYFEGFISVTEIMEVEYDEDEKTIYRSLEYYRGGTQAVYEEAYEIRNELDAKAYEIKDDINDLMETLKPRNKRRIRN